MKARKLPKLMSPLLFANRAKIHLSSSPLHEVPGPSTKQQLWAGSGVNKVINRHLAFFGSAEC